MGDRTFTKFVLPELPPSCGPTAERTLLHLAAVPNNLLWDSGKRYYDVAFTNLRPEVR